MLVSAAGSGLRSGEEVPLPLLAPKAEVNCGGVLEMLLLECIVLMEARLDASPPGVRLLTVASSENLWVSTGQPASGRELRSQKPST